MESLSVWATPVVYTIPFSVDVRACVFVCQARVGHRARQPARRSASQQGVREHFAQSVPL